MKKILFPVLSLMLLAGCSKNAEETELPESPVPIRLGSGVAMASKVPVTTGEHFTAGIAGWESSAEEDYNGEPLWNTSISTTARSDQSQTVSWTAQQYYNADERTTTYMKAWHPSGTLSGTAVTFDNTQGDVDVLWAPVVSGTKLDKETAKSLAFAHMTAQINFKVQAGIGLAAGTKLRSIKIKNVQLPVGFDLTKTGAEAVTYAAASDLSVPNIVPEAVTIGEEPNVVGEPVMIKPIANQIFTVDVETDKAFYSDQKVTVTSAEIEAGTAYDVTLTFGQGGISLTASVAEWKSATGSAEIK